MTHEYVILLGGRIDAPPGPAGHAPTALAWAADHVLAVGSDATVRAISRGDSTFLDLAGCVVTALPFDLARAQALVRDLAPHQVDVGARLAAVGLLAGNAHLEPGSPADLAIWSLGVPSEEVPSRWPAGLVAVVQGGHFTEGDPHFGPFETFARAAAPG
jgi:hypothetical protein